LILFLRIPRHCQQHDSQHAGGRNQGETGIPSRAVYQCANHDVGADRATDITEQAGKARSCAGGFFRYEIKRMYANEHNRAIDQEADRDQHGYVDVRIARRVEPVD